MKPATIMIVDDEREVLVPLTRLLQRKGFSVLTAESGDEALRLLERTDVEWVLSDLRMPGKTNGLELCRHIRHLGNDAPRMIMMSAFPEEMAAEPEIRQTPFLQKPFAFQELLGLLT